MECERPSYKFSQCVSCFHNGAGICEDCGGSRFERIWFVLKYEDEREGYVTCEHGAILYFRERYKARDYAKIVLGLTHVVGVLYDPASCCIL